MKAVMTGRRLEVGIDVSKATWAVSDWMDGRGEELAGATNDRDGFKALTKTLNAAKRRLGCDSIHVTVEPTAGYETFLVVSAYGLGWQVSVVHPSRVRDWARGEGVRAKQDQLDATQLAHFGAEKQPPLWEPPPQALSDLTALMSRRIDLATDLRQEQNRQSSFKLRQKLPESITTSFKTLERALQEELDRIDAAIRDLMDKHPPFKDESKRLDEIPGVGKRTLPILLMTVDRWRHLTRGIGSSNGIVAYVGLDPKTNTSGERKRARQPISRKGNSAVRAALYMAALGAISGKNCIHAYYDAMVARGKKKKVALVACARKILTWAWAIISSGRRFDPTLAVRRA